MTDIGRMILGRELRRNGELGELIGIPPDTWSNHLLITGRTGSGKSSTATTAITTAHQQSAGPTIVIDPKGSGWLREVARAEYAQTGTLGDTLYFDCSNYLPAMSILDIRRSLEDGKKRDAIIEDTAEHFLDLVEHVKPEGFDTIRSKDVIRYLINAEFDPVHGADAFPLDTLYESTRRVHKSRSLPDVTNQRSEKLLESLTLGQQRKVDTVLDGAITRIEKFYSSNYLHPLFNHVPTEISDAFTFDDWLKEDVLILIDIGDPAERIQRVLGNLVLEQLRVALERQRGDARQEDFSQVLLFIDEIANLRVDAPLQTLLSKGREFDIGVVPMLQYPEQLKTDGDSAANSDTDPYTEILNNCHSIISGAVTTDDELVARFSGAHMSEAEISNRLNNLAPTRWFFQPPSTRAYGTTQSFIISEPPLPPGHPDGDNSLTEVEQEAFEKALETCRTRTRREYGVTVATDNRGPAGTVFSSTNIASPDDPLLAALQQSGFITTLPLVDRLPGNAKYEPNPNALVCTSCDANRPPTFDGLLETLACHGSLKEIDPTTLPPVQLGLTLTESEIEAAPVDVRLLCGLQILANMAIGRYSGLAVDLVHDSPHDTLDQFGIGTQDIQTLEDEGLITIDSLRGYSYYTVTQTGRRLLQQPHRKRVEWGHTKGDNTETLLHKAMVDALRRYVEQEYKADENSPITQVVPYFELQESPTATTVNLDGGTRFDLVGLDEERNIRLIGEAERHNNDAAEAAVRDYEQIATIEPEEALWAVPTSSKGHDAVLTPLAEHSDENGASPIRSYSENTRISTLNSFDAPGMTGLFTLNEIRKQLPEPTLNAELL
jgi:hypothetical protein